MTHHKFLKKFHGQSVHLNIFEDFTWWGIVALNVIEKNTHNHTHTKKAQNKMSKQWCSFKFFAEETITAHLHWS